MKNPKLEKIELTYRDSDNKMIRIYTLEGEEASKWGYMVETVCRVADVHGMNPEWEELKWKKN